MCVDYISMKLKKIKTRPNAMAIFSKDSSPFSKIITLFLIIYTCLSVLFLLVLKLFVPMYIDPARMQGPGGQDLYLLHLSNP